MIFGYYQYPSISKLRQQGALPVYILCRYGCCYLGSLFMVCRRPTIRNYVYICRSTILRSSRQCRRGEGPQYEKLTIPQLLQKLHGLMFGLFNLGGSRHSGTAPARTITSPCQGYRGGIHARPRTWTHMAHLGSPERGGARFLLLPRATSCI